MKKVIITSGDPAGCGPYITLEAINLLRRQKIDFFVVGDRTILEKLPLYEKMNKRFNLVDVDTKGITKLTKGKISKLGGRASLNYIDRGLLLAREANIKRIITAPVSKEAVKLINLKFVGHTEYLAQYFGVKNYAMMMASSVLRAVPFSRHIPLREVSAAIKKKDILDTVSLVYTSLKDKFNIKNPRIVVASFNPHAGINTFLDKEEKEIDAGLRLFKEKIYGPLPADTIFTLHNLKNFDCVICPYHDQAMIPFKLLAFK
ncbi:MAG: 4-hydroxythreonine-4-phosphate dehydrogenase PdxA, partial [Candidatus Omnitrophota bacterium]